MMRLPEFRYLAPQSLDEAARILAGEGSDALLVAGGTDLLPNMKRRQQVPKVLVGLRGVAELKQVTNGSGLRLGAGLTLTDVVESAAVREAYPGLWQASAQVATPHLRNMGTLGGNLCLDTRCNYYDQNYEWRKAIDFCMKKDGDTCWVAPSSKRCLAVSSTDTAPALMALGARIHLVSARGRREIALTDLYRNDGIDYLTRQPDEILSEVVLEPADGLKSTYWKLRRRGAFDFPVLSVAAALRLDGAGKVESARIVLGSVAMRPQPSPEAEAMLVGQSLTDELIEAVADEASEEAKPMDNTDYVLHWRKKMARHFVTYALQELRGDDMSERRRSIQQHDLLPTL